MASSSARSRRARSTAPKIPAFEQLARKEVGKPGGSALIFVTEEGTVRAALTATRGDRDMVMGIAIELASRLPRHHEVLVEDQTGTVWQNDESVRRSAVED